MWYVKVHICTCFHPPSQSALVGAFNQFTFKVIIDTYDPISILLIASGLFFVGIFLYLCFLPGEVPLAFVVELV